jgi:hypothetical protein
MLTSAGELQRSLAGPARWHVQPAAIDRSPKLWMATWPDATGGRAEMKQAEPPHPQFTYYPQWQAPPAWVSPVLEAFAAQRDTIDTEALVAAGLKALESDEVLHAVASGLTAAGFQVEKSKRAVHKSHL